MTGIGLAREGYAFALFLAILTACVGMAMMALHTLTGGEWPAVSNSRVVPPQLTGKKRSLAKFILMIGGQRVSSTLALFTRTTSGTRAGAAVGALVGTIAGAVLEALESHGGWLLGVREVIRWALNMSFFGAMIGALVGALVNRIVAAVLQKIKQRPAWWKVVHGVVVGATVGGGLTASAWESFMAIRVSVEWH